MSNDGKILVQARYAVRNNQRNFLKITLPAGATIWSATLAGKPIRPGQSPDGSLLLPLEKARAGEDAPVFAVEVCFWPVPPHGRIKERSGSHCRQSICRYRAPAGALPSTTVQSNS